MKIYTWTLSLALVLCTLAVYAQTSIQPTFKVGLNVTNIDGPYETVGDQAVESYDTRTGFHVGGGVSIGINEYFGVRAELMYSQKGTKYQFDGPSYWVFYDDADNALYTTNGQRKMVVDISTSYLELPLMAYARFGAIELSAGASAAVLVGAKGVGELAYSEPSVGINGFTIDIENSYLSDKATTSGNGEPQTIEVGGNFIEIPDQIGAGYGALGRTDNPFESLDFSVNFGASFYLNKGLFFGARYNIGLSDVTSAEQDFSKVSLAADNTFVNRPDDVDKNTNLMLSIGFSF